MSARIAILFPLALCPIALACAQTTGSDDGARNDPTSASFDGGPTEEAGHPLFEAGADAPTSTDAVHDDADHDAVTAPSDPSQTGSLIGLADRCLDAPGGMSTDGLQLQLYDCNGTPAQIWTLSKGALTGVGGKCVAVRGGAGVNGAAIELRTCDGSAAQNWKMTSDGWLVGAGGRCLDVVGGGKRTDNGTPIDLWDCSGLPNQRWRFSSSATPDAGTDATPPVDATPPPPTGSSPVGGPGGYAKLVYEDSFGFAKPGATITDVSQFNPSTPYGAHGSGWDLWMKAYGEAPGVSAKVKMQSDHLELLPTDGPAGNVVSHFEPTPTDTTSYYIEMRVVTGRGPLSATWPALWLFSGNEPTANNQQSEIDIMETYTDQTIGPRDPDGLYTHYFASTSHDTGGATPEGPLWTIATVDVTTTWNVYGTELRMSGGTMYWDVYFNGSKTATSKVGLKWNSSAPAIIIGWNPGSDPVSPAIMKLDYVRVWEK